MEMAHCVLVFATVTSAPPAPPRKPRPRRVERASAPPPSSTAATLAAPTTVRMKCTCGCQRHAGRRGAARRPASPPVDPYSRPQARWRSPAADDGRHGIMWNRNIG